MWEDVELWEMFCLVQTYGGRDNERRIYRHKGEKEKWMEGSSEEIEQKGSKPWEMDLILDIRGNTSTSKTKGKVTENTKGEGKGFTEDRNIGLHPKPCSPFRTALITLEYLKERGGGRDKKKSENFGENLSIS